MIEPFYMYLAAWFAAGAAVSGLYHWTLWLTVKGLPGSSRPAVVGLVSFFGRMAVVLALFYLAVISGTWMLAATFAGFFVVKIGATVLFRPGRAGREGEG